MPHPAALWVWIVISLLISLGTSELLQWTRQKAPTPQRPAAAPQPANATAPGSAILKNYANPTQSPQQDLTDLHHVWDNFSLLVKAPLSVGANEDLALALKGRNAAKLAFVAAQGPWFNSTGQLIDRWQTPLFFHAMDQHRLDIRSAGPDRQMWTADDLHRRHDGQFLKGEALNAPSLFDATSGPSR